MKEREANEAMAASCSTQRHGVDDGQPASFRDNAEFWLIVGLALCALAGAVVFAVWGAR